jgi:hypothetical protein
MTNNWNDDKLPVVGKRYRVSKLYLAGNNNKTTCENKKVIVTKIKEREKDYLIHYKDDDGITNCLSSISFLNVYYEEDSEDNIKIQAKPVVDNKIETKNELSEALAEVEIAKNAINFITDRVDKAYDKGWHDGVDFARKILRSLKTNNYD